MRGESFSDRAEEARSFSERTEVPSSSEHVEVLLARETEHVDAWSSAELGLDRSQRVVRFLHAERWTGFSLALHALALFCMALMPPKSSALALDLLSEDARFARYLAAPVELDPPAYLEQGESHGAEGARAEGSEGAAGKPDAPHKPARMGRGKPRPADTDVREEARAAGILGVLPGLAASLGNGANPFDPSGLPSENEYGAGSLVPGDVGDSFGFNGLGMHRTGRGGGGDVQGAIGVGKLGTGLGGSGTCGSSDAGCLGGFRGRSAKVPLITSSAADVRGSLSKEAIRRAIQRHLNEVRFCYTEGLRATPELSGRVQVMFVISSAGTVLQASVVESELHQAGVERCIADAVRRWSFPAPDGGGYVTVRYPFVFEQIGQ